MLLGNLIIVVNHLLPPCTVREQLKCLDSGDSNYLILYPGQPLLIIITNLVSQRNYIKTCILNILFVDRLLKNQEGKFGFYRFQELIAPTFPETGISDQICCCIGIPE